jgi:glycosyltransferase involved in cell wall biosynthesis
MSSIKTLGICIPTYRRPDMLRRCVESAIESAQGRPVQIFIADDSVSEVNLPALRELTHRFGCVNWERNEVNLGIDRNIQKALSMSTCDYAWLIGEDDLFNPGGVAHVHELIQHKEDAFIFSNYQFVNEDFSRIVGLALKGEARHRSVADFLSDNLWSVGFIGSTVVRCTAWAQTSPSPYDGTYFTHVGRVVDLLAKQDSVALSPTPAIMNRSQGADTFTWKRDAFGVFFGFERMCLTASERNPAIASALRQAVRTYRREAGYLSIKTTFRLRSQGAFDLRQFRQYIYPAQLETWRKAWMLVLALTPRAVLRPMAWAYTAYASRRPEPSATADGA